MCKNCDFVWISVNFFCDLCENSEYGSPSLKISIFFGQANFTIVPCSFSYFYSLYLFNKIEIFFSLKTEWTRPKQISLLYKFEINNFLLVGYEIKKIIRYNII
jgi:hypothetical protein